MHLFALLAGGLAGMLIASVTGAAEGQGLAGGAVVLYQGLLGAGIGLIASGITGVLLSPVRYKIGCIVFGCILLLMIVLTAVRIRMVQQERENGNARYESAGLLNEIQTLKWPG